MFQNTEDVIVACSTGITSNTAIAVIRISGKDFLDSVGHFLSIPTSTIRPRYAHFCSFNLDSVPLDEIILTYFKGPNSFNGEDILELSVHGNQLNVDRIINHLCSIKNFRRALPGEFSFRALKNNKLNTSQVEGLNLFLNANSIFSLDQGLSLISGKLQQGFADLYAHFLKHKSSIEFGFDFLEDIGEDKFNKLYTESFDDIKKTILKLHSSALNQNFNLIKPEITIFGPPNAGKSSLFNSLLNDSRAIVSNQPGTTRDFLSEDISFENNIFSLIDTAGIRTAENRIEVEGIDRAKKILSTSFFKILLINPADEYDSVLIDLDNINFDLILFTHSDEIDFSTNLKRFCNSTDGFLHYKSIGPIEPSLKNGPIEPGLENGPIEPFSCSIIHDSSHLTEFISSRVLFKYLNLLKSSPVLIKRHAETINKIYLLFVSYEELIKNEKDIAIISSEFNILGHCISELIGIVSPDDILHNIFENFCIGK